MPSTTSSSVSRLLASSTVITPSLPTFSIALAIMSPISVSPLALIEPTWAISWLVVTFLEAALGAEGHLDRIGQDVNAAKHPVAGVGGEIDVFGGHLPALFRKGLLGGGRSGLQLLGLGFEHAQDVGFLHDQKVLAVELDLGA